jgi:hypothetical protein
MLLHMVARMHALMSWVLIYTHHQQGCAEYPGCAISLMMPFGSRATVQH